MSYTGSEGHGMENIPVETIAIPDTITFEHKFFRSVSGAYFYKDELRKEPLMCMPLDGRKAQLPIAGIRHEFKIAEGSNDARMLDLIVKGLDYVVALRIGDAIPSEQRSGEAAELVDG